MTRTSGTQAPDAHGFAKTPDGAAVRVLVVDDDPHIVRALRINLSAHGYHVGTATTGRTALLSVGDVPPTPWCSTSAFPTSTAPRSSPGCGPGPASGSSSLSARSGRRLPRPGEPHDAACETPHKGTSDDDGASQRPSHRPSVINRC
jgi:hypothetical protein